jgi:hypothetical protein
MGLWTGLYKDNRNYYPFFTLFCAQNKVTPFSPTNSFPGSANSSGSSEVHPVVLSHQFSSGSRRSSADTELSRQTSEMSLVSVEGSLSDNPALLKSLTKFQRFVYNFFCIDIVEWFSFEEAVRVSYECICRSV